MKRVATRHTSWRIVISVLTVLIILIGGAFSPSIILGQSCEVPLFVQQNLLGANLMLLVDNSFSMNAATYHAAYDADIIYSGVFTTESTYHVNTTRDRTPRDFDSSWPSTPQATLVSSDMGQDGLYSGNYLNWIYEHATDDQRNDIPQVTRIQVLKLVLYDLIYRSPRLRIGLTVFYPHGDGGNILAYCEGGNEMAVASVIQGMVANASTQLGESMETILDYFVDGGTKANPAIESPCQFTFIVVVTDGMPTQDTNVSPYLQDADGDGMDPGDCQSVGAPYPNTEDCSDHFDDVAYYMAHEDIRSDMEGDQNIFTYVVGFHEDGRLLQDAAENGLGLFFHAENASELAMCIEYAVQDILRRISAGSAVAVVSTERGTDDRLYRGKFMPVDWVGYLECYSLPYGDGDSAVWEAGSLLKERSSGSRRIFTALGPDIHDFTTGSAVTLRQEMGVASDEEAADLISWGRGDDVEGYRDRQGWKLGDIIHSTPVVVGPPSSFILDESYESFRSVHQDRRRMVYVGANDGMLHSFDAVSGEEAWAFVPEFALPEFQVMADSFYCHSYTCDQSPTVKDLKINGTWKTVLATGGREGGSSIFALDITEPDSPGVLWQNDLPNGKPFTSDVRLADIGNVPMAMVGSGLDQTDGEAWLYAYEMDSGDLAGSVLLSDIRSRNKATRPEVVDIDLDGNYDLAYVGDLDGNLWRIDFRDAFYSSSWDITKLFDGNEEITANPVAAYGPGGDIYIYFGTGSYLTEDDMDTVEQNRFICVKDNHDRSTLGFGDLVDQTSSISPVDNARGWYVELWNGEGERVTEQAVVVAETVLFTSFKPSLDPCVAGGESWLYQMAYDSGGFAPDADDSQDGSARSIDLGEGIASHPVVDINDGTVVIQSSDASISVEKVASVYQRLVVRSWQEDFDEVKYPNDQDDNDDDDDDDDDDDIQ